MRKRARIIRPAYIPVGFVPKYLFVLGIVFLEVDHVAAPLRRLWFLRSNHPAILNGHGLLNRAGLVDEMDAKRDHAVLALDFLSGQRGIEAPSFFVVGEPGESAFGVGQEN